MDYQSILTEPHLRIMDGMVIRFHSIHLPSHFLRSDGTLLLITRPNTTVREKPRMGNPEELHPEC